MNALTPDVELSCLICSRRLRIYRRRWNVDNVRLTKAATTLSFFIGEEINSRSRRDNMPFERRAHIQAA